MDVDELLRRLIEHYKTGTHTGDPFKVLIATIMSHRTNDDVTYPAADRLFERYGTPESLMKADVADIARIIYPVGFYNTKARRIKEVARIIHERYGGQVPDEMDELLKLPSVGRKTASCVLVFAFGKAALPVDTHVHRISNRLGLVSTPTPLETEKALEKVLPKRYWLEYNELLVAHGRAVCRPVGPRCDDCFLADICPKLL